MKLTIVPSIKQTKAWRKMQSWYDNGKRNECEKIQRTQIEKITDMPCPKTNALRINMVTNELVKMNCPSRQLNFFDYTEDFDGRQQIRNNTLLYNLKMVCDTGGAQTRTLREVAHFIRAQIAYAEKAADTEALEMSNTYFVNILEGDTSYKYRDHFKHLLDKKSVKNIIFIGDLFEFQYWIQNLAKHGS